MTKKHLMQQVQVNCLIKARSRNPKMNLFVTLVNG